MLINVKIKEKKINLHLTSIYFLNSSCPKQFDFYLMYLSTNNLWLSSKEN